MTTRSALRRRLATFVVLLLVLSGSQAVFGREFHLCSAMSGVVTDAGKPVVGAEVERRYLWHWNSQTGKDRVTTDALGRFRFPVVSASTFMGSLVPHQPMIEQTVTIRYGGREYLALELAKNTYEPNDELGGVALDLTCDLGDQQRFQLVNDRFKLGFTGICQLRQK